MDLKKYRQPLLTGLVLTAVFILLSVIMPDSNSNMLAKILIMMLFATSVNMMFGYTGLIAFGQAVFFGSSAYVYTLLVVRAGMGTLPAFVLAIVIVTLLSVILGLLALRVQALTFGLLFMGLNLLFYNLSVKIPALGSGSGIAGALRPEWASGTISFYYLTLGAVVICMACIYIILHSPLAQIAKGIRENEERLVFIGIDVKRTKLVMIVFSSFFASIAGILYAMLNLGAYTSYLNINISTQGLVMCLVGGMFTFWGPSLGAVLITIVTVWVSNMTIYYNAVLGVILILAILFFPNGLLGRGGDSKGLGARFFQKRLMTSNTDGDEKR